MKADIPVYQAKRHTISAIGFLLQRLAVVLLCTALLVWSSRARHMQDWMMGHPRVAEMVQECGGAFSATCLYEFENINRYAISLATPHSENKGP